LEIALVLDPLPSLKAYKDTSVAMMRALQSRGHKLFAIEQPEIFWDGGKTLGRARPLTVNEDDHDWYLTGDALERPLASFSAVLMRKDPPVDME